MEEEKQTIEDKINRVKTMATIQGIHNLTPPNKNDNLNDNQVNIIKALSVTPRLAELFLELRGMIYSPEHNKLIQISKPIMNIQGAFKFVKICQHISEETEWSNYEEEEINDRIMQHYETNLPYFTFWCEEYDLEPSNFNYIMTTLMTFIDSSFHKSKNAKYINSVKGMYSEGVIERVVGGNNNKERESVLQKYNPFKS